MSEPTPIVVVSGLPRAGTSMLMQMLAAGGLPVLADDVRAPDESNPKGYLEWEGAKRLPHDPGSIRAARGRAVKLIAALLPSLPEDERYLVLFAERDPREIDASQRTMLARLAAAGGAPPPGRDDLDPTALEAHAARIRAWLTAPPRRGRFSVLPVRYTDALRNPHDAAIRITTFLAPLGFPLDSASMVTAVDPSLYRTRVALLTTASGSESR